MKKNEPKTTVVIGASLNPERFSHKAVLLLQRKGHPVIPVGRKKGEINGIEIKTFDEPVQEPVHTVTLYLSPENQKHYYNYILSLNPRRVIFNPGTENPELEDLLKKKGIDIIKHCTLKLLNSGKF